MSGLTTCHACTGLIILDTSLFQDNAAGLAAFTLSLVANLWATSLIGCRAWQHRRLIKEYLHRGSGTRTLVEKTLALIAESGVLYCLIWIFVVAHMAIEFEYSGVPSWLMPLAAWRFWSAWDNFVEGALTQVIGIYPTIVIVMVALEKSYLDGNFTYDRPISVPRFRRPATSGLDLQTEQMQTPDQSHVHDHGRDVETDYLSCIESTEDGEADIGLEKIV